MTDDIGKSVTAAFDSLVGFFEDLRTLLDSLEQQLGEHGWECHHRDFKKSSLARDFYFLFQPEKSSGQVSHLILFQGRIASTNVSKQPLLLCAAVGFPSPVDPKSIWNSWTKEGGIRAMEELKEQNEICPLSPKMLDAGFASGAGEGFGMLVPVCSLRDAGELRTVVVGHLVKAVASLGSGRMKKGRN